MSMLCCVVWLLLVAFPLSLANVSKLYKVNRLYDDKIYNNSLVLERPSMSLLDCVSACGSDCLNYGFNFNTKKCRVHNCIALSNAVGEPGWRYFQYAANHTYFKPKDCLALYKSGYNCSGVYTIYPSGGAGTDVVCDMETELGGWTIIQNRFDGSVNFNRTWNDYKSGFGSSSGEYWIGNDVIHELTKKNSSLLYISLFHTNGTTLYEVYDTFSISSELDNYRLYIGEGAFGTLGNMIQPSNSTDSLQGMMFSTPDTDNDGGESANCASNWNGGWWFNDCGYVCLNVPYGHSYYIWYPFRGYNIKKTSMMLRRKV